MDRFRSVHAGYILFIVLYMVVYGIHIIDCAFGAISKRLGQDGHCRPLVRHFS